LPVGGAVDEFAAATDIVRLYRLRWRIEQVFRSMKSDGLRLEETQVQEAARLFKLAAIALTAAVLNSLTRGTEVLVRRWTSPMKILFMRPKPLARRLSAKRLKIRIRPVLSLGSPGSPLALADGTAITNHQAQRPCERVGTNSKPWRPTMPLQALDNIHESRRPQAGFST
jgi:hypothetical protein